MAVFVGWLIFSALAGMFANSKGRSFFGVFLLSLLLSPLIGFVYVLVVKPLPTEEERRAAADEAASSAKCPFCAETIKAAAVVCKHCGRDLPRPAAETRSEDEMFAYWLSTQKPPLSFDRLSPQEREEQWKAYRWSSKANQGA